MWPGGEHLVPPELLHTREWLHEVFQQAGKGLPWPHQVSLLLIEQAIVMGMFGGLLSSAWSIGQHGLRAGTWPAVGPVDLPGLLAQLEHHATAALPDEVHGALGHLRAHLDAQGVERAVGQLWQQVWGPGGPPPPFAPR